MLQMLILTITALRYDRKGVSAMEYAVLAAGVLAAVGGAVGVLSGDLSGMFGSLSGLMTSAMNKASTPGT